MKVRCYIFLFLFFTGISCISFSQNQQGINTRTKYHVVRDIHYGVYDRNTFDLYLPDTAIDHLPLVVFFHGGGFTEGDKSRIKGQKPLISVLLDKGIAFASVNYRFRESNDSLGVRRCLQDAVRFIQFIRYHAVDYKIDKSLIGCYGESAGAGTSLYLAFHDDMAVPASGDPIARESTRISCAGAIITQATYNLFRWKRILPGFRLIYMLKRRSFKTQIANFYGFESYKAFKPFKKQITQELDMLDMASRDDPPVWLCNEVNDKIKKGIPHNENQLYHHPAHAIAVGKAARKAGIVYYVITTEKEKAQVMPLDVFFEKYLLHN